jgi:hypothetical protein
MKIENDSLDKKNSTLKHVISSSSEQSNASDMPVARNDLTITLGATL